MKFKLAVILSIICHISLFALAFYLPAMKTAGKGETVYYVDFIQMPGSGGGGSGGEGGGGGNEGQGTPAARQDAAANGSQAIDPTKGVKDLTVGQEETGSKLRYPDLDKKEKDEKDNKKEDREPRQKEEKEELVSVIRKDMRNIPGATQSPGASTGGAPVIRIGAGRGGSGTGTGYGDGSGPGTGYGDGTGYGYGGAFPYSYYIDAIKNKISASWYSSLVTPGLRGKFVAVVYFKILRNGGIEDVVLESKSGIDTLDLSALRAVNNAAPFPPLPQAFPYRNLGVHFEFEWSK
jgi:TonB family protein